MLSFRAGWLLTCGAALLSTTACNAILGNSESSGPSIDPPDASAGSDSADGTVGVPDAGDDCTGPEGCVVVSGVSQVTSIDLDDQYLYWTSFSGNPGTAKRLKNGEGPTVELDAFPKSIWIGHDDLNVYWSRGGRILSRSRSSTDVSAAASTVTGSEDDIIGAAVSGERLSWATQSNVYGCALPDCSERHTYASGQAQVASLQAFEDRVYWVESETLHTCLLDGCGDGGTAMPISTSSFAVEKNGSATRIFYAGDKSVFGCNFPCQNSLSIAQAIAPAALVADSRFVWWRDRSTKEIARCARSGCNNGRETFIEGQNFEAERTLRSNDGFIYWATPTEIRRKRY